MRRPQEPQDQRLPHSSHPSSQSLPQAFVDETGTLPRSLLQPRVLCIPKTSDVSTPARTSPSAALTVMNFVRVQTQHGTPDLMELELPPRDSHSSTSSPSPDPADRPDSPRRSTESTSDAFVQALREQVNSQPRPRSPYSRTHLRSISATAISTAPPMARTRSLPLYETHHTLMSSPCHSPIRPSSPLRPPPAARASPRRSFEDVRPDFNDMQIIAEDSELSIPPRPVAALDPSPNTSLPQAAHAIPRSNSGRRRPRSPLQSLNTVHAPPPSPLSAYTTLSNASNTPIHSGISPSSTPPPQNSPRFNESYPSATPQFSFSTYSNSASSVSSTPTSFRSRSPSISSLETIPDTPDAEAEAAKAMEEIARLRGAAEAEESDEEKSMLRRGASLSVKGSARMDPKRKRWSVSGAESQSDFKMETIYEDP